MKRLGFSLFAVVLSAFIVFLGLFLVEKSWTFDTNAKVPISMAAFTFSREFLGAVLDRFVRAPLARRALRRLLVFHLKELRMPTPSSLIPKGEFKPNIDLVIEHYPTTATYALAFRDELAGLSVTKYINYTAIRPAMASAKELADHLGIPDSAYAKSASPR